MSNIIPQSKDNNDGVWEKLESDCRTMAENGHELLIVSGPSGFNSDRLPNGPVMIPSHTWKIVVEIPNGTDSVLNRINKTTRVIAVNITNVEGIRHDPWTKYVVSVCQLVSPSAANIVPSAPKPATSTGSNGISPSSDPFPSTSPANKKAEHFLNELAKSRDISAATQHQAFNAFIYFYRHVLQKPLQNINALRVSRPNRLRRAPTISELKNLLPNVPNVYDYPTNLIARLIYSCGLRVTEPLNLRIKDLNLSRGTLAVRDAKGGKDRVIPLPASLKPEIIGQLQVTKSVWQLDQQNRMPLYLPDKLGKKYPELVFAWPWAWLFPAKHPCRNPRTDTIVRFRMHEANVQRAIKICRRKLGIAILPHELRHG